MGKKINLAASRLSLTDQSFTGTAVQSGLTTANNTAAQKPHISALKRLGTAKEGMASATPLVGNNPQNAATRFMVTVTNDRNQPKANGISQPMSSTAANKLGNNAPQTGLVRKETGMNLNQAQQNNSKQQQQKPIRTDSSIEIIDLEPETSGPPLETMQRKPPMKLMAPKPIISHQQKPIANRPSGSFVNQVNVAANQTANSSPAKREYYSNKDKPLGEGNFQNRKRKNPLPMSLNEDMRMKGTVESITEAKPPLPGGRRRLFVAGFPKEGVKEEELKELFEKYGKVADCWFKFDKGFGFVTMDTKMNAEKAKVELDRSVFKGRNLNIRLASQSAVIKVCNLGDFVTNEILRNAFEFFGELERVCVACDYHLNPLGYGFVEFANKKRAEMAVRRINECPFVLTKSIKPISVKPLDDNDEEDGLCFSNLRHTPQALHEYSDPPRFLEEGTFEYDVAMKWKMQYLFEERQREHLELQLKESRERLELEVEDMYKNHKAWVLREELKRRQEELERLERFQSSDNIIESKRAYLDRAAQEREEQFRREEETFLKHQQQLKSNAEMHLARQMLQETQASDLNYGASGESSLGRRHGASSQQYFDDADMSVSRNKYTVQELMPPSDDYDFGGGVSSKIHSRLSLGGGGSFSGASGTFSSTGGGGRLGLGISVDANNFDIQPIRRQRHF